MDYEKKLSFVNDNHYNLYNNKWDDIIKVYIILIDPVHLKRNSINNTRFCFYSLSFSYSINLFLH